MNNMAMDIDPLSYEYAQYEYPQIPQIPNPYYHQNLKTDTLPHYQYNQIPYEIPLVNETHNNVPESNYNSAQLSNNENNDNNTERVDEPDVKPELTDLNKKKRGRQSSYWNVKVTDKNFAFYGCSLCNISYTVLEDLDKHVATHKDRITTYGLRVHNQKKKKQLKKEMKRLKKIKKEFKEVLEIKPEDGYIGNEKTADYENVNSGNTDNTLTKQNDENCLTNDGSSKKCIGDKKSVVKKGLSTKNENVDKQEQDNLQKIYKCFACQKQFLLSYYLRLHVRSHTDEKPYLCSICGQSFITASKRGRHTKRMHLAVRHQCRICYKYFSRFELLTRHFDKKHPDDKLEGEPYDYNAILPYLKELEEQLKEKTEGEDYKPKDEGAWKDADGSKEGVKDENAKPLKDESEGLKCEFEFPPPPSNIIVEEVKIDIRDEEVQVKKEVEDQGEFGGVDTTGEYRDDTVGEFGGDDAPGDDFGDGSCSDEDYFPSNTWAATPKADPEPASPVRTRKGKASGKSVACEICNKVMKSKSYLKIHLRTHTGEKPFKCFVCDKGFITATKMHRHALTQHANAEGAENIPEEGVKLEAVSEEENLEGEKKGAKTKSKKTKPKFTKTQKKGKERKKHQKRPHACEYCRLRFLHLETLEIHKKSHEGEQIPYNCYYCLESMGEPQALREHEATHGGPKPFLCTLCGREYKKREAMVFHRKHHKPGKEFICDICSKRFPSQYKLQRHIATHNICKYIIRYECPVCAHMFHTKYHIQMHLTTHQKEGLIMEENRNEILAMVLQNVRKIPTQPGPSSLPTLTPSDERSRVCNICGEIFTHFYFLEEHLKTHGSKIALEDLVKTEEKKYVCQVCNKSFKLHYYLKLHSFTHTKEKPFICQQCGKGFITKGKLKRHLEVHTGLKKYQCHVCYKFFTRPSYLRIHVRTIHGTQDYNFRADKPWVSGIVHHNNVYTSPESLEVIK